MRVLHVAPSIERSYGGPTQSLAGYAAAASVAGHEVHVGAPEASETDVAALVSSGVTSVKTFASTGAGGLARSPALVRWVAGNCASFDIVHVHGLFNFISTFAARSAIASGAAVVIRPFGTLSRYTFTHRRGALKRLWFNALERRNVLGAAGVHFTTTTERDEARWHQLSLDTKAHVVPPPFVAATEPHGTSHRSGGERVLFVGRLNPIKNLEALIDAWPLVTAEIPDAHLIIAGAGELSYEKTLRARVAARDVGRSIEFTGFVSAQSRDTWLARSTVLVLPSYHENFGMSVLEAVAAGIPVVVSEHVQLRDFVEANKVGVVADVSPQHLAAAILGALRNSALRERVARFGRGLVRDTYSPERVSEALEAMYVAVIDRHHNSQLRQFS